MILWKWTGSSKVTVCDDIMNKSCVAAIIRNMIVTNPAEIDVCAEFTDDA